MEEKIIGMIWNDYMHPAIEANTPLFILGLIVMGAVGWKRPTLGALLFTLCLTMWVAKIVMEDITFDASGATGFFMAFMSVALIVNGVLLYRQMTS
jgi:hypothetical protein